MKRLKSHMSFGGQTAFWSHDSRETKTEMKFSTFVPAGPVKGCIIWLSGLTCTEENFITKAGAQRYLADAQLMVIAPDTSPRGLNLPGEHESDDFGSGASFYVDATTPDYASHYRMYSYIVKELYPLIGEHFQAAPVSIMGHSMGGHGALVLGLRHPELFRSVSAFAPIVHPSAVPWGQKALEGYLGSDRQAWQAYDACELLAGGKRHPAPILIHQGSEDPFLNKHLKTEDFRLAARAADQQHVIEYAEGYDHSYYFIASFMAEHIQHHRRYLRPEIATETSLKA